MMINNLRYKGRAADFAKRSPGLRNQGLLIILLRIRLNEGGLMPK